eukprot:365297-Chlamydomonas_euryale.AAC.5
MGRHRSLRAVMIPERSGLWAQSASPEAAQTAQQRHCWWEGGRAARSPLVCGVAVLRAHCLEAPFSEASAATQVCVPKCRDHRRAHNI